jgi:hypothetical protein
MTTVRSLASVCALVLLVGCGRVEGQFIVVQDQVPQTGCTIPGDLSALYRPDGFLDVSIVNMDSPAGYLLFPLLENDLPGLATGQLIDSNRIALVGWHVDLQMGPGTPQTVLDAFNGAGDSATHYDVPTSGSVASGGGHTPSSVDVFPPPLAVAIRGTLDPGGTPVTTLATVHAIGNRINGSIQSDDFVFPISVCSGCLIGTQSMCPFRAAPANPGNPCNPAQDQIVDCCTINGNLVCPPLVSP